MTGLIGRVARTEVRVALRDGRVRWTAIVLLGLLVATGAEGWRRAVDMRAERARAQHLVREQWLGQRPKDPHAAAHFGTYVFQPVSALAFLDPGLLDHVGVAGFLEAHRRNEFRYRPAADAPAIPWFGPLTPAAVLQQLVPLVVLLLTYAAVAAERESGMLRQLRSVGSRFRAIALGKRSVSWGSWALCSAAACPWPGLARLAADGSRTGRDLATPRGTGRRLRTLLPDRARSGDRRVDRRARRPCGTDHPARFLDR